MGFMEYVKSIEWEHESYPDYDDCIALPVLLSFFPLYDSSLTDLSSWYFSLKLSSIVFVSFLVGLVQVLVFTGSVFLILDCLACVPPLF
ncbi:hypothetical protein NC652_021235 [Populus alba x Populus x berolinensis]|nr:hypothetical protein NC652_021235 [Populus alba x Populus x berolinensis]